MMRAISALVFLAVALLLVMGYQATKQELAIRVYMTRLNQAKKKVQFNEKEIVDTKLKLDVLNNKMTLLKTNQEELITQISLTEKQKADGEIALKNCIEAKEANEKKKTELTDTVSQMKETQEAEKAKAQLEVQNLKQQILDRDKALCALLEPNSKPEGRQLCGM